MLDLDYGLSRNNTPIRHEKSIVPRLEWQSSTINYWYSAVFAPANICPPIYNYITLPHSILINQPLFTEQMKGEVRELHQRISLPLSYSYNILPCYLFPLDNISRHGWIRISQVCIYAWWRHVLSPCTIYVYTCKKNWGILAKYYAQSRILDRISMLY